MVLVRACDKGWRKSRPHAGKHLSVWQGLLVARYAHLDNEQTSAEQSSQALVVDDKEWIH